MTAQARTVGGANQRLSVLGPRVQPPNIIIRLSDDEDMLMSLPGRGRTKFEQNLLAAGTYFKNHVSPRSLCSPDRAALFTGQYKQNNHVSGNNMGSPTLDITTLIFKAVWGAVGARTGQTALVGKVLNGYGGATLNTVPLIDTYNRPTFDGIDEWYAWSANEGSKYNWQAYEQINDADGNTVSASFWPNNALTSPGGPEGSHADDWCRLRAVSFINTASNRSPSDPRHGLPYLLVVTPSDPHDPNTPAPPVLSPDTLDRASRLAYYANWVPPQYDVNAGTATALEDAKAFPNIDQLDPQVTGTGGVYSGSPGTIIQSQRDRYRSLVGVDDIDEAMIQAVASQTDPLYGLDNTIFITMGDNGFTQGQNGDWQGKETAYDATCRTPCAVRGPFFDAGVVSDAPIATIDWAPTICSWMGVTPLATPDGIDLTPYFTAGTASLSRRAIYVSGFTSAEITGVRSANYTYWTQTSFLSSELEKLVVSATAGTYTLTYRLRSTDTAQITAPIAWNANAAAVQLALTNLAGIGAGNVTVTGGPGDATGTNPYMIQFGGTLANTLIQELVLNTSGLTGTALVTRNDGLGTGPAHATQAFPPTALFCNVADPAVPGSVADPFQRNNLAGLPAYAEVQAQLEAAKNVLKTCAGGTCQVTFYNYAGGYSAGYL